MPVKAKKRYAVLLEGETEFWYFQMLKRNERGAAFDIKPEIPQKKSLEAQYQRVIELSRDYDKVFWMVDLDVVIKETRDSNGTTQSPIDLFMVLKRRAEKKPNITVIINQPCFEYWVLIHFEENRRLFDNCEEASRLIMKHLSTYAKTERYYTNQGGDIYLTLKDRLCDALLRSVKTGEFDKDSPNKGLTNMHELFAAIGIP